MANKLKIVWDTTEYRSNHGAEPRGYGSWAFDANLGVGPEFMPPSTHSAARKAFAARIVDRCKLSGFAGSVLFVTVCS